MELLIAFETNVLKWPGMNQAFLFSFLLTTGLAFLAIPYAKRRPKGTPTSWGEAMLAATFVFGLLFLAFGVVPDRFIAHADAELGRALPLGGLPCRRRQRGFLRHRASYRQQENRRSFHPKT